MNRIAPQKRVRILVSTLVLVATAAVASGGATAASGTTPPASRAPGVTAHTISIGFFLPLTGLFASAAPAIQAGVQAAFDEVNAAGGINGRRLVLKTYDDGTSDAQTIIANHRKAQSQVFAYMTVLSTTNEILAPIANKAKVPLIYTDLPASIGKGLKYAFSAWPYLTTEAAIMPSYIVYSLKGLQKKIGVVYEGSTTAISAEKVFVADAANAGLNVVVEQPVVSNQATCTTQDTNLQSAGVQIVVLISGPIADICMLRDAATLGYAPTWTGLGSLVESSAVAAGAGAAANGLTVLSPFTTVETPARETFCGSHGEVSSRRSVQQQQLGFLR